MSKNEGLGSATLFEPYLVENEEIQYICSVENQYSQNFVLCLTDVRLFLYELKPKRFTVVPIKSINYLCFSPEINFFNAASSKETGISLIANSKHTDSLHELFRLLTNMVF